MRVHHRWLWLAPLLIMGAATVGAVLCGCPSWTIAPVVPPTPPGPVPPGPTPPGPTPVPPNPTPVPPQPVPSVVVPYATVQQVVAGVAAIDLPTLLGTAPVLDTRQDDGTRLMRWAAVNAAGEPRWLIVHVSAAGVVLGRSLIPRPV